MDALATVIDVELRWRPLTADEVIVASTLIEDASAKLRRQLPTIDTKIADGDLTAAEVAAVIANVVKRVLRNPDGVQSETIDGYTYQLAEGDDGELHLTAEDLESLTPDSSSAAFTITPGGPYLAATNPLDGWA